jgi:HPt (histidine-containing phosphotransfer) domain-containing protein
VVALTANVSANDTVNYARNGFDSWLGKPFVARELWQVLEKFVKPTGYMNAMGNPGRQRAPALSVSIDSRLGVERAGGDEAVYKGIQLKFLENHLDDSQKIRTQKENAPQDAKRMAHTLKGLAGLLGAESLRAAALAVEKSFENGSPGEEALSLLDAELAKVLQELEPLRNASEALERQAHAFDKGHASALEKILRPLLEDYSTKSKQFAQEALEAFESIDATKAKLLVKKIEDYNFVEALQILNELSSHL